MTREQTKPVKVRGLVIGGGASVSVQSMTNTKTADIEATAAQILRLEEAGCQLVRCSAPDMESARAIQEIKKRVHIPIAADIHFDYRLAIEATRAGADKLRINPGNIGDAEKVKKVASAAKEAGIPIRVGVNSGSVERGLLQKYGGPTPEAIVESALLNVRMLEEAGFFDIIISVKSSSVTGTIRAYEILSGRTDYPLHVGITEAGTLYRGTVKSAVGIGAILSRGIGDTVRVSLTDDPVREVECAREILRALKLGSCGPDIIACPTCARTRTDIIGITKEVEKRCKDINAEITIAVMGCAVNGPGEAREADFGIAGGDGEGLIFAKGRIIKKVPEHELVDRLMDMVLGYCGTKGHAYEE